MNDERGLRSCITIERLGVPAPEAARRGEAAGAVAPAQHGPSRSRRSTRHAARLPRRPRGDRDAPRGTAYAPAGTGGGTDVPQRGHGGVHWTPSLFAIHLGATSDKPPASAMGHAASG